MRAPSALTIRPERPDSPDGRLLIGALDAYLASLYPPEENFTELAPGDVEGDRGVFLVGSLEGRAVACGALRLLNPGAAEVKRMWVDPERRGLGCGKTILAELQRWAQDRAVERLVLETGNLQVDAIGLYRSFGFRPIPCFGEYAASRSSVCFEMRLD